MRLLGGDFSSRLNSVIREEKGYSYGVSAGLLGNIDTGAALYAGATVARDIADLALIEFFSGFESLRYTPVSQEELDRTVTGYQMSVAGMLARPEAVAVPSDPGSRILGLFCPGPEPCGAGQRTDRNPDLH